MSVTMKDYTRILLTQVLSRLRVDFPGFISQGVTVPFVWLFKDDGMGCATVRKRIVQKLNVESGQRLMIYKFDKELMHSPVLHT